MADEEEYRGWRVVEGPGTESTDLDDFTPERESTPTVGPALGEIPDHTGPNAIEGIELFEPTDEEDAA